jgi:putative transposase
LKYNPDIHHRRSVRLTGYDYSQAGYYFITVCTQGKRRLFGEIENGQMILNDAGKMIGYQWNDLADRFKHIKLDEYVVMPNHFHGIIIIGEGNVGASLVDAQIRAGTIRAGTRPAPTNDTIRAGTIRAGTRPAPTKMGTTVGDMVGAFKSITSCEYINGVKNNNWKPFDRKLWQRNYYEHIIRDETALGQIREYIVENCQRWQQDELFIDDGNT